MCNYRTEIGGCYGFNIVTPRPSPPPPSPARPLHIFIYHMLTKHIMQFQTWQKAGSMWLLATVVLVKIQLLIFLTDVCPDLGTLTSSRRRLTDELKFTILTYQAVRLPTYRLNHDTNHARRYNPLWEDTYSWLRYSPSTDGVFCGPCFVFGQAQTSNAEFFTTPFSDWKNAIGKKRGTLVAHNASNVHCDSNAHNSCQSVRGMQYR